MPSRAYQGLKSGGNLSTTSPEGGIMSRVYAIIGLSVLALAIIIAVTTCMITQPPVDNAQPAQQTQ
jgi:hypothetical protein